MKNIPLILFYCLFGFNAQAQFVIKLKTTKSYEDYWSRNHYNDINTENQQRLAHTTANTVFAYQLKDVIAHQKDELKTFSNALSRLKPFLVNFLKGGSFNKRTGYQSYGYIQKKYPVFNPLNPGDVFRNTIIQYRFSKKLTTESNHVNDYLDKNNPIPEGERILLVLTALENSINLTLENEKY